jgi:Rrf2 family protein
MSGNTRVAVAIHIMTALAFSKDSMSSVELAKSINTNAVVVRRLLIHLARAGLIQCSIGKAGGSTLARDASEITLADIYNAVNDRESLFSIPEKKKNRGCPVSCKMQGLLVEIFDQAEAAVQHRFNSVILSDLVKQIN